MFKAAFSFLFGVALVSYFLFLAAMLGWVMFNGIARTAETYIPKSNGALHTWP